ncbi:hypothetical protein [Kitasatospora cinereorecta]|uniref:Uncharacterized protein n=1 Tax=Kitasatospora cinereorecta TaxID=285560 RepID=A0ABW0VMX0_9ACTN
MIGDASLVTASALLALTAVTTAPRWIAWCRRTNADRDAWMGHYRQRHADAHHPMTRRQVLDRMRIAKELPDELLRFNEAVIEADRVLNAAIADLPQILQLVIHRMDRLPRRH